MKHYTLENVKETFKKSFSRLLETYCTNAANSDFINKYARAINYVAPIKE